METVNAAVAGRSMEQAPRTIPCRFCGAKVCQVFVDLGVSPLANSYLKSDQLNRMEPFYPLKVYVCGECLLVQLEALESPAEIFSNYAYFSSFADTWVQHAAEYVDMAVQRFHLTEQSQVVELASNDGYLLQHFLPKKIAVLGIEPAANVAQAAIQKGIPTLVTFFGEATARELVAESIRADLIVGNNVLAHVPELNDFVRGMKILLKPGGVITLEFPHLMRLMEERQFDTIYHEHFSYFTLFTVEQVFSAQGLKIFDVEELGTHGGSLRIFARHAGNAAEEETVRLRGLRSREQAAGLQTPEGYRSFAEMVKETKRQLLQLLIDLKRRGRSIVGYGAPAKGNTLLNYCGVGSDFLDYTVDRSPHKQGQFLPGTHLPILHPDTIRETRPDYLLILPWNLREEIVGQMSYIREWGGQFIVPIPEPRVYA
jgi:2-polyprenyl-3-methyl-5-hydroxy-6-metoxy-1,4-benzoquinol methylase